MNFLEFDSGPPKGSFLRLKDSPKIQGNDWIIGLYKSFLDETTAKNAIAKKLQGNISIFS
ncbi:Ankyrin domain containing protein [Dorcoceras hygrometricum]|uniref:Ankyrin domain containing protein n=1 Tax=Dorcoceras hygrometricum TaxID=472368 RepID=A0A2Z7D1Z5_9LAMI|nr:Ankyrin domain containing protein [Dorcoceras hygrometricum]